MEFKRRIVEFSLDRYRQVAPTLAVFTLVCAALILWAQVDTAPQSMLSQLDAARIFHEQAEKDFAISRDVGLKNAFGRNVLLPMTIAAPLALLTILFLNASFFRRPVLVLLPMIVAEATRLLTMGLLVALRSPAHQIDAMIPLFLMPISVVGSVYVLSGFFERYASEKGRRQAAIEATRDLFSPTLHMSLTLAAGFALLKLTPLPPVQAFGLFVAVGIMIAWVLTIVLFPVFIMFIGEATLENLKAVLTQQIRPRRLRPVFVGTTFAVIAIAIHGVMRMSASPNAEANQRFAGDRTAYLVLEDSSEPNVTVEFIKDLRERLYGKIENLAVNTPQARDMLEPTDKVLVDAATKKITKTAFLAKLSECAGRQEVATTQDAAIWHELARFFDSEDQQLKLFQQPEMLRYIVGLVDHLRTSGLVDKDDSIAAVVQENSGPSSDQIPDSIVAVAQTLLQFQISHAPQDVSRFVAKDFRKANIWLELKSDSSRDMRNLAAAVRQYFEATPPPMPIRYDWAGQAFVNLVWRQKMASGMLRLLLVALAMMLAIAAIPIAVRRRSSASMAPAQPNKPGLASSLLISLSIIVVVLLIMDQFCRTSFSGFVWISVIAAPILAALSASLVRRQIGRTPFAQQAKATAA
ncbi:MAG: MMPL family transporter [Solirubrobacterales bacterium]